MELISLSPVAPLTVHTCALSENIVEGPLFNTLFSSCICTEQSWDHKAQELINMTTLLASAPTLTRNWLQMKVAWSSSWILLILQKVLELVLARRMEPSWQIHSVSVYLHMYAVTCMSVGLHLHHVHCKQWIFLATQALIVANGLSATQIWPIACRVHMHHRIVPVANPVSDQSYDAWWLWDSASTFLGTNHSCALSYKLRKPLYILHLPPVCAQCSSRIMGSLHSPSCRYSSCTSGT